MGFQHFSSIWCNNIHTLSGRFCGSIIYNHKSTKCSAFNSLLLFDCASDINTLCAYICGVVANNLASFCRFSWSPELAGFFLLHLTTVFYP